MIWKIQNKKQRHLPATISWRQSINTDWAGIWFKSNIAFRSWNRWNKSKNKFLFENEILLKLSISGIGINCPVITMLDWWSWRYNVSHLPPIRCINNDYFISSFFFACYSAYYIHRCSIINWIVTLAPIRIILTPSPISWVMLHCSNQEIAQNCIDNRTIFLCLCGVCTSLGVKKIQ